MDFSQFYKGKAVVIIGTDGRRDEGRLSHHAFQMDQGSWQCWDVVYTPTGTTIAGTTDLSAQARHANFGGNPVESYPNLVTEKCFHVDDPRNEGRQSRFIFAEEGEAGEQHLLDVWQAAQAGQTLTTDTTSGPDVSTGQQSAGAAPMPQSSPPDVLNPQIPEGQVVEPPHKHKHKG